MQRLRDTHKDMLDLVAAHARETSQSRPNPQELTRLRLEMMKVHRRRLAQLAAIASMGENLPVGVRDQIKQFQREDVEMTAFASRHVGEWPIERIVAEWETYKEMAAHNYSWQRDRIAREVTAITSKR